VFLVVGYLFFLPVLGSEPIRWRLTYPVRFIILVLVMPVDTFTGLMLGYGSAGTPGVPVGPRPAWAPSPVSDLHLGGAVMWIGGDAIMFGLMMLVYMMWSLDDRAATSSHGWLESARRASLARLVDEHLAPAGGDTAATAGAAGASAATAEPAAALRWDKRGGIDDDEHLAAYNAFLARLNDAESSRKHR
jgi:putative copper resistance protein D